MSAPNKIVYTVTERNGKSFWTRIGAAFINKDGSLSVTLEAVPVNGRLQIREKPVDAPGGGGPARNSDPGDAPPEF